MAIEFSTYAHNVVVDPMSQIFGSGHMLAVQARRGQAINGSLVNGVGSPAALSNLGGDPCRADHRAVAPQRLVDPRPRRSQPMITSSVPHPLDGLSALGVSLAVIGAP
jgi:hypothetical protein